MGLILFRVCDMRLGLYYFLQGCQELTISPVLLAQLTVSGNMKETQEEPINIPPVGRDVC